MKKWVVLHEKKDGEELSIESIIDILLKNRGIFPSKEEKKFFHPQIEEVNLDSVGLQKESVSKAISRIDAALKKHQSIVVYTDYDADGICSGAIMWETLYFLGAHVMPYVPNRMTEGYGLSRVGIETVKNQFHPELIITLDHGIAAYHQIEYAKKLGIDVIILDHHLLPTKIPDAYAIIHTTKLSATGITWLFCNELKFIMKKEKNIYENLDLAALATIADLVPLTGFNRVIAKLGLEQLKKTKRIGLEALIQEAQVVKEDIDMYTVGHVLAPRINAIGRLQHAIDALRLLCTKNKEKARLLARNLSNINKTRQRLTEESVTFARQMVVEENEYKIIAKKKKNKIIILSHASFSEGIIGLVAGKLVEEFYLPSVVIAEKETYSKASARSIAGYDIVDALHEVTDLLVNIGGHPMAAGFTVETGKIALLKQRLQEKAVQEITDEVLQKLLKIDMEIPLIEVNNQLLEQIKLLSPFGMGNLEPVFCTKNLQVTGIKLLGQQRNHIKLRLKQNDMIIEGIGFHMGNLFNSLSVGSIIQAAYSISENKWNNHVNLQLHLRDVKISS